MQLRVAKEFLHMQGWFERVNEIVSHGEKEYLASELLQEAGDSLMMKVGESCKRLLFLKVPAPHGVEWELAVANRNFNIHQYDEINRRQTWLTLSVDLTAWRKTLDP